MYKKSKFFWKKYFLRYSWPFLTLTNGKISDNWGEKTLLPRWLQHVVEKVYRAAGCSNSWRTDCKKRPSSGYVRIEFLLRLSNSFRRVLRGWRLNWTNKGKFEVLLTELLRPRRELLPVTQSYLTVSWYIIYGWFWINIVKMNVLKKIQARSITRASYWQL